MVGEVSNLDLAGLGNEGDHYDENFQQKLVDGMRPIQHKLRLPMDVRGRRRRRLRLTNRRRLAALSGHSKEIWQW